MKKKIQSVLCGAWLTAMLSTAASSFAETVQLAQLTVERFDNTISVTVPETIPEGLAKFYLVWDATDKGENAAAWAHRQAFDGEITSGGTCTFDATVLPTGYVYRVIGASDVELIDGYIALTGTQYIDTGVSAAYLNGFDLRFRYTESVNKGPAYLGDECVVIGSLYRTGEKTVNNISIRPNADDGKEKTQFKLFHRSRGPTSSEIPEPSYFNFSDGAWKVPHDFLLLDDQAFLDGEKAFSTLGEFFTKSTESILLGNAWHSAGSTKTIEKYGNAEWHFAKFYYGSDLSLVAHFVPALKDGVAVLYDTVSGTCVSKQGTAASGAAEYDPLANVTNIFAVAASELMTNAGRRAVWRDNGWNCTEDGVAVENGEPDAESVVVVDAVGGDVPSGALTKPFTSFHLTNCKLEKACDLSGLAVQAACVAVEYIDVPAGSYLDTGFKPDTNTRVTMDVTVRSADENWFGVWNQNPTSFNNWYDCKGAFALANDGTVGGITCAFGDKGGTSTTSCPAIGSGEKSTKGNGPYKSGRYTVDLNKGAATAKNASGTQIYSVNRSFFTTEIQNNLYLFAINAAGTAYVRPTQGTIRCHGCKIYQNGELIHDYVPAKCEVYGFYDMVDKAFVTPTEGVWSGGVPTGGTFISGKTATIDIDVAGQALTLPSNLDAVSGRITDSVGGGQVCIAVAEGETAVNTGLILEGGLKLVKSGTGTLVGAVRRQSYTGGTDVMAGTVRSGVTEAPWGSVKATVEMRDGKPFGTVTIPFVTVADGASFDFAGKLSTSGTPYSFTLAGSGPDGTGALVNSEPNFDSDSWMCNAIGDLTLSTDATIGGYPLFGFSFADDAPGAMQHTLTLNEHTLSINLKSSIDFGGEGDQVFSFRGVRAADAGSIIFNKIGTARTVLPSFYGVENDLSAVTFTLNDGCGFYAEKSQSLVVGSLIDNRLSFGRDSQKGKAVTVLGTYKPASATLLRTVTLGDAEHQSPTLDLSALTGPFDLPAADCSLALAAGATLFIDFGDRAVSSKTPVITWTTAPVGLNGTISAIVGGRQRSMTLKADGLYLNPFFTIILR